MEVRFGVGLFLLSFLPLVLASSQQNNKTSDSLTNNYQLSRKPCQVKGQEGTCMFVWECVKTEGTPLGMCMERFMFGSCCAHDLDNNVVPKPSVPSSIGSVGVGHATTIQNTGGAITPGTASLLTTLITRTPPPLPTTASWSANSTENVTTSTVSLTIGSSVNASVDFISSNELELTASRTNNSVTSSTPSYTSTTPIDGTSSAPISSTQTPSSVSSTKPTGSQPTSGPNKIRPKPYRRTTTRKPAVPTVASGISNTPVATNATAAEPLNQALMPSLAPLVAPAINLLIPNTHAIHNPIIASPSVTDSSLTPTTQLSSTLLQLSDVLVAITVPSPYLSAVPITESNSAILMAPIDLPDPPASLNELNYTAEIPDAIPTASDKPYYDPSFHAHFTTGSLSTTDEADFTESETLVYESTSEGTTMVTPTTTFAPTSFATNEFTVTTTEPVAVTTVTSVDTAQSISTPPSSTVKPVLHVTPPSIKNTTSTEITKRPIMAVTSLPSSHPSTECGIAPLLARQEGGRIVGGTASKFGSWPWQVSVRRTSFFGFSSTHRCGGALLNELWVITAGHCVEDLLVSQIRLRMGEFDFSSVQEPFPFIERGVNKKIVHPKYNFFTYEYDLALVRLEEPVTFQPNIVPICLPATDETLIGQNGTVTGWGRLSEGGTLPSMLQQVTVPIVSNDKCKDMFLKAGRHEYIPDIFMCAGFEEGGRDSCQGDSGGPLQIRGKDGKYFLAGIISWGIGCAEANLPGVCTRISKFTSWILENVT